MQERGFGPTEGEILEKVSVSDVQQSLKEFCLLYLKAAALSA
jgi:hypothetical protein